MMAASEDPESLVFQAIQRARYNETVHIEISGDGGVREISLVASLDEHHGGIVWNPVEGREGHADSELKLNRHLRTKRWVLPMLNDRRRNSLYHQAIITAVDKLMDNRMQQVAADCQGRDNSSPATYVPDIDSGSDLKTADRRERDNDSDTTYVLDIGSGSGLLAMMSAKAIMSKKQRCASLQSVKEPPVCVYAIEMSSAMALLTDQIIKDNEMERYIRVLNAHSSKLATRNPDKQEEEEETLASRVDLCVSELLESGLLGEGLLPSLRHAWQNLLKPNAIMVPQSVRVFAAAVEGRDDDGWISRLHPSSLFTVSQESESGMCWDSVFEGSEAERSVVFPLHAEKLLRDGSLRMLTEPACVISIGLDKDLLPDEQGQEQVTAISVTSAGTAHAILVWWELDLWQGQRRDEESITYSMDPRDPNVPFQDHWQHCLHVLPEALRLSCGDVALLRACHDDSSIQVQFLPTTTMASPHDEGIPGGRASKRPRYASVPLEPNSLSPLRTLQLTDPARLKFFRTAIQDASSSLAQTITGGLNHLHVLDISDFGWCGILAGVQGCRVTSLECSPGNVQAEMTSRVAQASRLPEDCRFDVLACHTEQLNREILGGVPDIVIAEPFYQVLEGWHLQEALNFWYTVRSLRRKAVLSSDTVVIPSACRIMACGIESQQLRASYAPCGDDQSSNVCGFDHRALNRCCCISETTLTLPLWQYNYRRLTAKIEVGYLDYTAPQDDGIRLSSTASVAEIGRLDALVIWLDYLYETRGREGERVLNLPTDSRSFLQGVRMLKTPVALSKDDVCRTSVEVDLALGDLNGSDDHTIAVHLIREDCS